MIGSVLSIVLGYLVFGAGAALLFKLSGQDPRATPSLLFAIGATIYGSVCSLLAGYAAASLAPRKPRLHAGILAAIIAATAAISLVLEFRGGSVWAELVTLLLVAPAAFVGGQIRTR